MTTACLYQFELIHIDQGYGVAYVVFNECRSGNSICLYQSLRLVERMYFFRYLFQFYVLFVQFLWNSLQSMCILMQDEDSLALEATNSS